MKKLFVLLLILTHLFATSGFSVGIHECGGVKSYSVLNIQIGETCECDHATEHEDDDCCKDKKVVVKAVAKDKISSKALFVKNKVQLFAPYIAQPLTNYQSAVLLANTSTSRIEYSPHRYSLPLYIMYGEFLI
ncbi:MAG: hypothetical protein H7331_08505 [Bacteroidia bacterium]|nr:hypothetical protein [Bacteroidia bacterium]